MKQSKDNTNLASGDIAALIEAVLYAKAADRMEQIALDEAAKVLGKKHQNYDVSQHPGTKKWHVIGRLGRNKGGKMQYMPVSDGFDTKGQAQAHIPHLKRADRAAKDELSVFDKKRVHEGFLAEADPTPTIWNDEKGLPISPKRADWEHHYNNIAAHHVQAQLDAEKARRASVVQRWRDAADKHDTNKNDENHRKLKHAEAHLKNVDLSIATAEKSLKQKRRAHELLQKKLDKKKGKRHAAIHKAVTGIAHGLFGGSPMMGHIVRHLTNLALNHEQKAGANTTKA